MLFVIPPRSFLRLKLSMAACFSYLLIHTEYRRVAISSFGSRSVTQGSIVNCHIVCESHAMRMEGRETAATRYPPYPAPGVGDPTRCGGATAGI